jgi:predicted HNH restriction endonuclease
LYSLKTKCIICGESEPVCLDFHHINSEDKEFTISKHRNRNKEWLLTEINKCVCLCANCHRKVHAGIINLEDYLDKSSSLNSEKSVTE